MVDYKNAIIEDIKERGSFSRVTQLVKNQEGYKNYVDSYAKSLNREPYKIGEILYCIYYGVEEWPKCYCGKDLGYQSFKRGFTKTCNGKECLVKKKKETIKNKYGGEHYMKDEKVRKKFNDTMVERYGVKWAQQSEDIRDKSLETYKNNPNKEEINRKRGEKIKEIFKERGDEIIKKRMETKIKKYGSIENYNKMFNESFRKTSQEKYGVDHHFSSEEFQNKRIESYEKRLTQEINDIIVDDFEYINRDIGETGYISIDLRCNKCSELFTIGLVSLRNRHYEKADICLKCNPRLSGKSKKELEVLDYIKTIYNGDVSGNVKIDGKEVDIYLPEYKLGF